MSEKPTAKVWVIVREPGTEIIDATHARTEKRCIKNFIDSYTWEKLRGAGYRCIGATITLEEPHEQGADDEGDH